MALKAVLTHNPALAGCIALSTWLEPSKLEVIRAFFNQDCTHWGSSWGVMTHLGETR